MKLVEIIEAIEKRLPKDWAESWDNPGLQAGRRGAEIEKIALALDASPKTVERAARLGCGLLVTHHPIFFRAAKSIVDDCHVGRTLLSAIQSDIALYAAHTNWDSSPEGVNFILASSLGLENISPLVPSQSGAWGLAAVGDLPRPLSLDDFGELVQERWGIWNITFCGEEEREISRVALGGGACMDFWPQALAAGAQCFITSDVTYHPREEATEAGLGIVSCDHGEMERFALPALASLVSEQTGLPTALVDDDWWDGDLG